MNTYRSLFLASFALAGLAGELMLDAQAQTQPQFQVQTMPNPTMDNWSAPSQTQMQRIQTTETTMTTASTARLDSDMQKVLDAYQRLGPKPVELLTPQEARRQPTPADAVKTVLTQEGKSTAPEAGLKTADITIPGPVGMLPARVYTPTSGKGPFPVIVYYHGGGWVTGNINKYDASARALAQKANAIVVSVHYRQAPEHPFSAAHQDAFAAYQWVIQSAQQFNGDPKRVAVAGESAGGNLAANVSIMARERRIQMPVHQVLIYPVAGTNMNTPSYQENANAMPLNKAAMQWYFQQTLKTQQDWQSPAINLVNADLRGLPETTIVTAEIDPLRSEGLMLADQLRAAGVLVNARNYDGVTHEFFGMDAVEDDARNAQAFVGSELSQSFRQTTAIMPATGTTDMGISTGSSSSVTTTMATTRSAETTTTELRDPAPTEESILPVRGYW